MGGGGVAEARHFESLEPWSPNNFHGGFLTF